MSEYQLGHMAPRADLQANQFDTAIKQKGYRVWWEQGMFCPCEDKHSGQPDPVCPACGGNGYYYLEGKETRVLVTSINSNKFQTHIGLDDLGTAYLTALSTDRIGFRDRFTFMDFTVKFSEIIDKAPLGEPDQLRYEAKSTVHLRTVDKEYQRGVHFDLSKDGYHVEWINERELDEGDRYSILYNTPPTYIAMGPIHDLRGTATLYKAGGQERFEYLSQQYQIKREDFLDDIFKSGG
jgi:hypothetical protein